MSLSKPIRRSSISLICNSQSCYHCSCIYFCRISHCGWLGTWNDPSKCWQYVFVYLLAGGLSNAQCARGFWMWRRFCKALWYSVQRHVGSFWPSQYQSHRERMTFCLVSLALVGISLNYELFILLHLFLMNRRCSSICKRITLILVFVIVNLS